MTSHASRDIAFIVLAMVTLVPAALVVSVRNLIHAALLLGASFVGVAGLYILLNAEFIAAAQVLVYVGAITVLIIFAIMLTQRLADTRFTDASHHQVVLGLGVAAMVAAAIWTFVIKQPWPNAYDNALVGHTSLVLGMQLITAYIVPFEVTSLLLLAALIAAVALARGEEAVSVPAQLNELYDDADPQHATVPGEKP